MLALSTGAIALLGQVLFGELGPVTVQHDGESIHHHIEKATDAQSDEGNHQKAGGAQGEKVCDKHVLC